ncbi:hypothetical protein SAMN05444413_1242 [Roseivivax marinus]|uniref:hypothetical protein n=1 Tax=Roseivivax marinus TaxID=1379903 RepID=UPI0008BBE254|nr:hypothetical protein [Roseivivax marinus]SEL93937.1 hypothetical protein SAMN05444413_1242 [Roseivivax marinus]
MRRRDILGGGSALVGALAAPGLLRAQATWSFRDFGARADGSDDAGAIEEAFSSGETLINNRFDRYTCKRGITVSDVPVTARGGRIEFPGRGDGLSFIYGVPAICDLDDLEILSTGEGGGTGLTIATAVESQVELDRFRYARMVRLGGGMVLGGHDRSRGGWARALHLDTVNGADIGPVSIHGPAKGNAADARWRRGSIGIAITGRGGATPTSLDFGAMQIRNVETGVLAQGGMEGVAFRGPAIVNVRHGLVADWLQEGGRVNPRFVFDGGHINAAQTGMSLRGVAESHVTGTLFYRFLNSVPEEAIDWRGLALNTCDRVLVTKNIFNGWSNRRRAATPGAPIQIERVKRSLIANNRGHNLDSVIQVRGDQNLDVSVSDNVWEGHTDPSTGRGQTTRDDAPGLRVGWSY